MVKLLERQTAEGDGDRDWDDFLALAMADYDLRPAARTKEVVNDASPERKQNAALYLGSLTVGFPDYHIN